MEIIELMRSRNSVREYLDKEIEKDKKELLTSYISKLNEKYKTNVQIVFDDEEGFKNSKKDYGKFSGCKNYIALVGNDGETCGYVGMLIALKAQEIGLNTCFVAMSYNSKRIKKTIKVNKGEKIQCCISLGYGKNNGFAHKSKTKEQVLEVKSPSSINIDEVVEACLLAPTALNQQKFKIVVDNENIDVVKSGIGFYLDVDLGIVKAAKDLVSNKISLD